MAHITQKEIEDSLKPKSQLKKSKKEEEGEAEEEEEEGNKRKRKRTKLSPPVMSFEDKKKHIAELCESIMADPETAFKKQPNSENTLFNMLHEYTSDIDDEMVQQIAILSEYVVFNDILPSTAINLQKYEIDSEKKHKKAIQKQIDYETKLLKSYKMFLQLIILKFNQIPKDIKATDEIVNHIGFHVYK